MSKYNNKRKGSRDSFPIYKYVGFTSVALILLLFYLWQQTENEALIIKIENLKMKKSNLQNINQHLQLELEHLIKLSDVENVASEKLNMKFPNNRKKIPTISVPEKNKNINLKSAESF